MSARLPHMGICLNSCCCSAGGSQCTAPLATSPSGSHGAAPRPNHSPSRQPWSGPELTVSEEVIDLQAPL